MIIDANNLIAGRLGGFVAKRILMGEDIKIVNSEEAVITGKKEDIYRRYKEKLERGHPRTGPFMERMEDRFLRRIIKGMLPHQARGIEALRKLICYIGFPNELKDKKFETIEEANVEKTKSLKYLKIKDVCKFLGKKVEEDE